MKNENLTINEAISNLEKSSDALASWADNPKNYNSDLAHMLSMMALEMRSQASTLRETNYLYGVI